MRKMLMAAMLLVAPLAFAQAGEGEQGVERPAPSGEAAHPGGEHGAPAGDKHGEEHAHDVPGYILHHVMDAPEYEFEVPLADQFNKSFEMPAWKIAFKAGACDREDSASFPALLAGCLDITPTKHTVMMWISAVVLVVVFTLGANRNKSKLVPHGTSQNLLEMLVLFVRDEIAIKNIGKEWGPRFTPYLLTVFFFILFMNLMGLVPWMATATGNLAVTAALAFCTFVLTQYAAIRAAGLGTFLKHLTGGVHFILWPIMIPVELLGLFTKPFALTIRLFANMVAGHIVIFFLLGLIFMLNSPAVAIGSVPLAIGIYILELFVAFVQAYIFAMLSSLFIGMGVAMAHHDDHGHDDHGHGGHAEGSHSHDHGKAHMVGG